MGDVIRSTASVDDIFKDLRTTFTNVAAKGGVVKERAEPMLAPVIAMVDAVVTPAANVNLLGRVRTALGRSAQFELANLKRLLGAAPSRASDPRRPALCVLS